MRRFTRSVKTGSHRLWPAVLAAAAFGTLGAGCIIVDDGGGSPPPTTTYSAPPAPSTSPPASDNPMTVTIDADKAINADPGQGVGLYVEYQTGGQWHVWTTCDTSLTGYLCDFDAKIVPQAGDRLTNPQPDALESNDTIAVGGDGSLEFTATTDVDTDGVMFTSSPGSTIQLEMFLDGARQGQFVYWLGSGVLHAGAPTDPVVFSPASP